MKPHAPDSEFVDDPDNPELDADFFARARPGSEVLPEIFGKEVAAAMLRPRGRPKTSNAKVQVTLRLDPDVVGWYRATGPGWQARMNDVLKLALK